MCLLLTLMAAVAATVTWYACEKRKTYRLGTLCLIYWGAGLMWLVDFFFEYFSEGAAYFQQSFSEILNDSLLGLSAVTWAPSPGWRSCWSRIRSVCSNSNKLKRRLHRSRPFSLPEKS